MEHRAFYAHSLTQTGLIRRLLPRVLTNEFHVIRVITMMYGEAGDTAECINFASLHANVWRDDSVMYLFVVNALGCTCFPFLAHFGLRESGR